MHKLNYVSKFVLKDSVLLSLALGCFIILRIPSLFEPHWYGDEGIYASIAYALEHGKKLYIDVFDNRLPGIYYLYALGPSEYRLVFIRLLNLIAGMMTIVGIYHIGKKLELNKYLFISLAIATWFLGSPRLEGNIANTENFFIPLTIWGAWFALSNKRIALLISGMLFGCAFIIKFPPFFTFCAVGLYLLLRHTDTWKHKIQELCWTGVGFILPILVTFTLLFFNGNLKEAIQFGLLNNTSYVTYYESATFSLELRTFFLVLFVAIVICLYIKKEISSPILLLFLLLLFDYYAAIFSARKYVHYLQQIVPTVALFASYLAYTVEKQKKWTMKVSMIYTFLLTLFVGVAIFLKGEGVTVDLNERVYYQNALSYIMQRPPQKEELPFSFFREPQRLATVKNITHEYQTNNIFFYTNESWIYDFTKVVPPTLFVVKYHVGMVPKGEQRVIDDLQKSQPNVIVIDKNEEPFEALQTYIDTYYVKDKENDVFVYFIKYK
jgi:hypothetical protein